MHKNRKCEIAKLSLKIARMQMSNAQAVTKPQGSRMGSLVGKTPTLIRRDLRVASGSRGLNLVNTWFLAFCLLQKQGLQRR